MSERNGFATKKRILDACEQVYALGGMEALTLREITERAGTNLAAVNYHFRSKETLTTAMLKRHLGPVHDERLILLERIEAAFQNRLRPTHILAALLLPTLAILTAPDLPEHFKSFALRCSSDPSDLVRNAMASAFHGVTERVDVAFTKSAKNMDSQEAIWRSKVFFNSFAGTVLNQNTLSMIIEMLKSQRANVFDIIFQFSSVMECVMHQAAKRDELHILVKEALEVLEPTSTYKRALQRLPLSSPTTSTSSFPLPFPFPLQGTEL